MRADDRALAEVAASVADGEPVDWAAAEARLPGADLRLARHLRLVESISTLYRTLPSDDDEPAGTAVEAGAPPALRPWGTLVLLERIGEGTTGEVYRAFDSRLHRDVALKLLHHDRRSRADPQERVLEEARRLARLRHEHVVSVYGAEEHDGRVGLWMELVRGEPLEARVKAHGPIEADEAVRIGGQICAALSAVHASGLLHRDVKAQNVIQEPSGRIVLMDFGTGEELRRAHGTNRMVGTPLYLAPEIFKGQAATVQSDIYSLGVLLFYLVTGEFPVEAASMLDLGRAHSRGERRRLVDVRPDLPGAFADVIDRALDPAPARRFRTAAAMEAALGGVEEPPVEARARVMAPPKLPQWLRAAAAAAALALAVLALIVWSGIGARPSVTRLAVLPFTHGPGTDASVIADALTDELIGTLGQIDSLEVIARASAARFQGSSEPPAVVAAALGVDAVLQPDLTILREGDAAPRARVHVRLIAAGTGATMWAQRYERDLGAAPTLLADVAHGLAQHVNLSLRPDTARRLDRLPPTSQAAAEAYFQGLHYLKRLSPDETRLAIGAFERATALDPAYAAAFAGLAWSYVDLGLMGAITHAEARALAQLQIDRALALDAESSEARVVNGDLKFYYNWEWRGAEQEYQKAIGLNSSSTRALTQYARYLAAAGRLDASLDRANRAVTLNPLSSSAASTVALVHLFRRDYESALEAGRQAVHLDPASGGAHIVVARILTASGKLEDAVAMTERAIALSNHAPPGWRAHLIGLQAQQGRRGEARAAMEQLVLEQRMTNEHMGEVHLAYIHLALSEPTEALALIERAADDRSPDILWFGVDPRVDALRGTSRFERVLARVIGR